MKLLLDSCVWGGAKRTLSSGGHDVVWAGEWPQDPGDEEILKMAYAEGRTLVTLDKDFGEMVIVQGKPNSGILRLVGFAARDQAMVCMRVLELHGLELSSGAIITAEPGRIRIRPPHREIDEK